MIKKIAIGFDWFISSIPPRWL